MHQAARTGSKRSAAGRRSRQKRIKAPSVPMLVAPGVEVETLLRSTLDSLSAHVAVLDATGTIIAVNKAWRLFAKQSGYGSDDDGVGSNYLAVCERSAPLSRDAAAAAKALRDIMAGRRREFRMAYPCTGPD